MFKVERKVKRTHLLVDQTCFLVVEGGDDFRFIPVDGTGCAMTSMFRDAGDVFVRFVGCSVCFMLTHPCAERNSRLAYVFSVLTT